MLKSGQVLRLVHQAAILQVQLQLNEQLLNVAADHPRDQTRYRVNGLLLHPKALHRVMTFNHFVKGALVFYAL